MQTSMYTLYCLYFAADIHATCPHKGQKDVAKTMRALLDRRRHDYDAAADLEGLVIYLWINE